MRLTYADPKPSGGYPVDAIIVWHFDENSVTLFAANSSDIKGALANGATIEPYAIPEPPLPKVEDYQNAIQAMVDEAAGSRRYKSGDAMATYVASTVGDWASEAQAFVAWRDDVWQYAYSELAKVQGGVRAQPTVDEFLAELPEIQWPVALAA